MSIKTLHNKTPCCNAASGIKHDHWDNDAVLTKNCKKCGAGYVVTFEMVKPFETLPPFRDVRWERTSEAGGRPMEDEEDPDDE